MINENDQIRQIHTRQTKRSQNWISYIETSGETYKKLIQGNINIGWKDAHIVEDFNMKKCYKCQAYGHLAVNCTNRIYCGSCTGNHYTRECQAEESKCINCLDANNKYKTNYNTQHSTSSYNCPCYKFKVSQIRQTINYDGKLEVNQ